MSDAVQQATEVIRRERAFIAATAFGVPPEANRDCAEHIARGLFDAGLLATGDDQWPA